MSNPRIIAGKARGIRLQSVPGDSTRPITDQVKEALFNILGADIQESFFLDLFGGTGSVGIEALSRGAAFVRFIEINRQAISIIKNNLKSTRLSDNSEVIQANALVYLHRKPDKAFHYIYIAPPQYKGMWKEALQNLDAHMDWLASDAWAIVQIHPVEYEELTLNNLVEFEQRKYGSTLLIFYETKQPA
jgi:16S rRNA (guanine966-N2)-methyltransferase